ncbi:hypothetical protein GCM10007972_03430 [Iodidimonas muriae]|uniref:Uncharacterized protein n=1 Tax=Iodidimonas muriae TaxID=261467 RepID=A0ABQ2L752_9PROT|nr:hypothetical protein [Iodidimonas muriae]GER08359.1 hypothetical protein JCM17843_26690 [Kordiimonadales bacterium JCM 17843]GGO05739.1 hypothetical protein GCM10007972_03430 [Iodidimonas muriae]
MQNSVCSVRSGLGAIERYLGEYERRLLWMMERDIRRILSSGYGTSGDFSNDKINVNHIDKSISFAVCQIESQERIASLIKAFEGDKARLDAVFSPIAQGVSFSKIDRKYQKRNGWARKQLGHAMRVYACMEKPKS